MSNTASISNTMMDRIPMNEEWVPAEDFMALPDHKRQRNVERRLDSAMKRQFKEPSPTHRMVAAVRYDGAIHKLDGHTRSEAWRRGLLQRPSKVLQVTFDCAAWEDYLAIYSHFDSAFATETKSDILSGAITSHDVELRSTLLRGVEWGSAMRLASRGFGGETTDIYTNVDEFIEEIKALDARGYVKRALNRGQVAGYFALRRKYDAASVDRFFDAYTENRGDKDRDNTVDGVQLLRNIEEAPKSGSGNSLVLPMCEWTIACYEAWAAGKRIKLYKIKQWDGKNGRDLVVPKIGRLDETKIGGFLRGRRNLCEKGAAA